HCLVRIRDIALDAARLIARACHRAAVLAQVAIPSVLVGHVPGFEPRPLLIRHGCSPRALGEARPQCEQPQDSYRRTLVLTNRRPQARDLRPESADRVPMTGSRAVVGSNKKET